MKNRFEVRGPAIGPCSICGTLGPLTADHVPPKGAQRLAQVEMAQLWRRLNAQQKEERPPQFSQNGVKFHSICKVCNTVRLGAESDPEFLRFTKGVAEVIGHVQSTALVLPRKLTVRAKPRTVLRSVVGHMLALNVGRAPRGPMEEAMAQYVLDPTKPLHRAMDVLYWLYPYNDQVLIDTAVITTMLGSGQGGVFFKLLKFYPLAFMLTWERAGSVPPPLLNLADYRNVPIGTEIDVDLDVTPPPHQLWPEAPTTHGAVLYGGSPRIVEPRRPSKKGKPRK